ncbi:hypothetical protein L5515_017025 [Caenorhabditis briggsae]|uniref:Uncharacterized protein n=1 Tax=Caenorhabditis briggsae TaxID=6238 RepID=A0AAE9JQA0_CAEBR|nr:hypothetical protein L5515_017025 [Caenorhabditis briggsae]
MVKRGPGRPRKDTNSNQGTSKGADSKRSRTSNIPDSEDDVQSIQKIKDWFGRQRHLKSQNQFTTAMKTFFRTRQFLEKTDKVLESESGGGWKKLTVHLVERSSVVKTLQPGDAHAEEDDLADSLDEEYFNYLELDQVNDDQDGQRVDYQEEDVMESENYGYEIDTLDETPIDEEVHDQMKETVLQNRPLEIKDIPLLNSSREGDQKPPVVNHIQNTFDDFPDETKNVPRFVPAPGYRSSVPRFVPCPGYRDQSEEPRDDVEGEYQFTKILKKNTFQ